MWKAGLLGLLTVLSTLTPPTSSYPSYADRIPNGGKVPHPCKPNYLWRGVGHTNPLGGGDRNSFGRDFRAAGSEWNEELCRRDSDGDGLTNGQELGDPDCVWTQGQLPSRTSSITHPGVCDPWTDSKCRQNNTWVTCDVESLHCDAIQNDPDVRNVTLRFPPTAVPDKETNYYCMTFDLPSDRVYHLVATEPYIDNAEVMHHIVIYGCEGDDMPYLSEPTPCGMEVSRGCESILGLWQVGYPGNCIHPDVGYAFGKGSITRIKMEYHWNNPELRANYTDSSGVRFFYTPKLRPNWAATLTVGQLSLDIPPRQPSVRITGSCSSRCSRQIFTQPVYVIEAVNHMHYLGISQKVELFRGDNLVATLTNDEVYNYDAPVSHLHDSPIQILPGDEIRTTCVYSSQYKDTPTHYGDATSDEMCFAFLMLYPREALSHTTYCLAYKDQSTCRVDEGFGDCDTSRFLNASYPGMGQFIRDVASLCPPFGPCTTQCAQVMEPMADEPCLQGQAFERIKQYMMQNKDSLAFLARLTACRPGGACPTCPRCPGTGRAVAVKPALASVAAVLSAALFLI